MRKKTMRWSIKENKRKISTTNFTNHKDDIEMSGEKASMIIGYGADQNNIVSFTRKIVFPMFRIQPDVTTSSYILSFDKKVIELGDETFQKAEIDGMLSIYTKTKELNIVHRFYPSTTLPVVYERVEIENTSSKNYPLDFDNNLRIETKLGCEGFVYAECNADNKVKVIKSKEKVVINFAISARFCNDEIPSEKDHYEKRIQRVNELLNERDLTTGNDVIDTMFAFAKIRVGTAIFNTRNGRINSPCGLNYYAGIWANDQCEYSTPWFAFTNDKTLKEAAFNAMKWYEKYMSDTFEPMVSSIISEGTDYWNGRRDRGDAEMYLYGNSRLFLTLGILPSDKEFKMLDWAAQYIKSQILEEGVVYSDTDELEFRLSSGINLSTSTLAYGAFNMFAILLERMNKDKDAKEYRELAKGIRESIDKYFGGTVSGFETYHYHKGCDEVRAWVSLPTYMGISERAEGSLTAIDKLLWRNGSCLSTENENITWDRSALYYIAACFRSGYKELGYNKLKEISETRLLGERVPYVIEAYPEYNMRHLSAESALYARTITDGLLNVEFTKEGFKLNPMLPKELKHVTIKNIFISGELYNIEIENVDGKTKESIELAK